MNTASNYRKCALAAAFVSAFSILIAYGARAGRERTVQQDEAVVVEQSDIRETRVTVFDVLLGVFFAVNAFFLGSLIWPLARPLVVLASPNAGDETLALIGQSLTWVNAGVAVCVLAGVIFFQSRWASRNRARE